MCSGDTYSSYKAQEGNSDMKHEIFQKPTELPPEILLKARMVPFNQVKGAGVVGLEVVFGKEQSQQEALEVEQTLAAQFIAKL